jgi:DME family drug/metabolite transporter
MVPPSMTSSVRGVAQVAAAAVLWGMWSLFLRPTGLPGVVTAPAILVVMGVSALALVRAEGKTARWDRKAVSLLALYALLDALNVGAFFAAMEVTTVAIAVLTHCTAPVLVALLAPRIEGVRVKGSLSAALIALSGLVLLLRPWEQRGDDVWLGAGLGLSSALAYASLVFTVQPLAARIGIGRATSYHALLAAVVFVPFAAPHAARIEEHDLLLLLLGGLLPGTLSAYLFIDGLRRIGSARAAVLTLLEPMIAVLVGFVAWHEPLAPIGGLGAAMVLGAAVWVARASEAARSDVTRS